MPNSLVAVTVEKLKQSLHGDTHAFKDKWMTIPDMGHLIATKYKVVLVSLSSEQNITFFPLRGRSPFSKKSQRLITIGFVNKNHFVQVQYVMFI